MKSLLILAMMLLSFGFTNAQDSKGNHEQMIAGNCYYKGIQLWGKVQFVTSFPDIKIQYVESFPDIKVKFVTSFPDECGLWQITESFPDFKVQVVTSFPDIKIKVVTSFPGID